MRRDALIPSMFHRRLAVLAALAAVGITVLIAQAARLTLAEGDDWLTAAESRLVRESLLPTTRGQILDRKGRILARDAPAFDVLIDYQTITGTWAELNAQRDARREYADIWPQLSPEDRAELVDRARGPYDQRVNRMRAELAAAIDITPEELDDRTNTIKQRVQRMAGRLWAVWREERIEALSIDGRPADVSIADVRRPIREQQTPHVVAAAINADAAARVRRIIERDPELGLHLEAGQTRLYPLETQQVTVDLTTLPPPLRPAEGEPTTAIITVQGVDTHTVGWMRELNRVPEGAPLDTDRRPRINPATNMLDLGYYRPGDTVGGAGIEAAREDTLRGTRGLVSTQLDTNQITQTDPAIGGDVTLTIDAQLQARITAVLDPALGLTVHQPWHSREAYDLPVGTPLNAAVVVLDVDNAEILAMVSTPSFTRAQREQNPEAIYDDPERAPWVNRAIAVPYAAGSIVKPLVLVAAVTEGVHHLSERIYSAGHLFPDRPMQFRSWSWRPERGQYIELSQAYFNGEPLNGAQALAVSCNIYFYTLGRKLGFNRLQSWYQKFGVEQDWNLGLGFEYPGNAATNRDNQTPLITQATFMGIGQGPVDWTPLHAANMLATIARDGVAIAPRIDRNAPITATDLNLDPTAIDAALQGLKDSIQAEYGTGHHIRYGEPYGTHPIINVPGVEVLAKTGTAQATPLVHDPDGEGPEPARVLRSGNHAWVAGLVAPTGERPRYAIAVLVEYGASGGRVAGPVFEQVVHALVREGYL